MILQIFFQWDQAYTPTLDAVARIISIGTRVFPENLLEILCKLNWDFKTNQFYSICLFPIYFHLQKHNKSYLFYCSLKACVVDVITRELRTCCLACSFTDGITALDTIITDNDRLYINFQDIQDTQQCDRYLVLRIDTSTWFERRRLSGQKQSKSR